MGYKCENCGCVKEDGSRYWQVRIITSGGKMSFVPTCSEECANKLKDKYYNLHMTRAESVERQCFQIMKWE